MLAPVLRRIKESELQSYRLENGLKLWGPLWDYRHPDASCFTTYCKLNPHRLWSQRIHTRRTSFDVLPGRKFAAFLHTTVIQFLLLMHANFFL